MKKTIGTLALLALGTAVVLLPAPARAACGNGPTFGQQSAGCGGAYCYVTSPGLKTSTSLIGSFWSVNFGDPLPGPGTDNGTFDDSGWLIDFGGNNYALAGSWSDSTLIDGCIDVQGNGQPMAVALTDVDASNGQAYFAAACVTRNTAAGFQLDFSNTGTNIALKPIPKPVITGSVRQGNGDSLVTVASPNYSDLYYSDGSPGCAIGNVIEKYDVWVQKVARDGAPPTNRNVDSPLVVNWSLGNSCNIGSPCQVTVACGAGVSCDAFITTSPKFDSNFATTRVGTNSNRVQAGQTLATPPKPKTIKKFDAGVR